MNLQLLDFDCSEDAEGVVCWDALAQPAARHNSALLKEVALLLAWCHRLALQGPGALEDGFDWDFDLQVSGQDGAALSLPALAFFDVALGQVRLPTGLDQQGLALSLSLSLSGTPAFAQAIREQFDLP